MSEYSSTFAINAVAEQVGIEPAKKTFAELQVIDTTEFILRLARNFDKTNILIRKSLPPPAE